MKSINNNIKKIIKQKASDTKSSNAMHPQDFIFKFVLDNHHFKGNPDKAIEYYFNSGLDSASKLKYLIENKCQLSFNEINLLEFASGYGCVTRHLINLLPPNQITCCDIHSQAIDFQKKHFSVNTIQSSFNVEELNVDTYFKVVFALSFFSHLPKTTFKDWIKKLAEFTEKGGYIIFTTHGDISNTQHLNYDLDEDGFAFQTDSEQKDLSTTSYGLTVSTVKFVLKQIFDLENLSLQYFQEGLWWNHQDLYILKKIK